MKVKKDWRKQIRFNVDRAFKAGIMYMALRSLGIDHAQATQIIKRLFPHDNTD
jgi:hypothetical protein